MALHFVTAAAEEDHVDSSDDARRNAGTVGSGSFVFGTGNKMAGSMTDPNTLRILDGDAMISGRHWNIDNYEEVVIENGTPGMNRWDLVVANAKTNPSEVLTLKVYKGVETEGEPVLPSFIDGDLNGTDTEAEQPLYAVLHTGLSVGEPVAQFEVWMSESEFRDSISPVEKNAIWTGSQINYRKEGSRVYCDGQVEATVAAWKYLELSTIPDGMVPKRETSAPGIASGTSGAKIIAQTDGKLRALALADAITAKGLIFNFSWVVA